MIVFDIETTGLCVHRDRITVIVCVDTESGVRTGYQFGRILDTGPPGGLAHAKDDLIERFDQADSLAAYNGVCFDINFIVKYLSIDSARATRWVLKCVDLFEMMRVCTGRFYSLNSVASKNKVSMKTSNGRHAIVMADNKQWDELLDYCLHDVLITKDIYQKPKIYIGHKHVSTF